MKHDEATYSRVRAKFDEWEQIRAEPPSRPRLQRPSRPFTPEPASDTEMGKNLFAAIGFGIGALLLLLAGLSFYTAGQWAGYAREGAFAGYILVGVFLTIAGVGGIAATWNHNFRVLPKHHRRHGEPH